MAGARAVEIGWRARLRFRLIAALLCLSACPQALPAQPTTPDTGAAPPVALEAANGQAARPAEPTLEERLLIILAAVKAAESEQVDLAKRLRAAPAGPQAKELAADLERVADRLQQLRTSFEELATGGATVAKLEGRAEERPFDWKEEIEDVVRPLLEEVKRMTERPRTIERLRSEKAIYTDRLELADRAIRRLSGVIEATDSPTVREVLQELLKDWQSHRADADSRLQLAQTQLQHLLTPEEESGGGLTDALREFFSGRGLNMALALAAFGLSYAALLGLARLLAWLPRRQAPMQRGRFARAGTMLFRIFAFLIALSAAMGVLSVRGDWLILGVLILFLFGLVLALRNSLPRYVEEMRILLDMGGVREGERVIHGGIPWRIKSLNVFSTLHNPLLSGGTIRVPIREMATLQSRQYTKGEPWFPTREGDYVMLKGDIFGRVLLQTPELVQVQVIGATTTWPVTDFLAQYPRNLSLEGFAIPISFGLDYSHQAEILTTIVAELRAHLQARLAEQVFHGHLKDLIVDFNEAASSSLNLIIVAVFEGAAAEHYWTIRRLLQRSAVEACNRNGWVIPFDQLTVHLPGAPPTPPAGTLPSRT
jgi:hypothetical protein